MYDILSSSDEILFRWKYQVLHIEIYKALANLAQGQDIRHSWNHKQIRLTSYSDTNFLKTTQDEAAKTK